MLHYRKAFARLQMPQVAGEGLSDDVKRAIIQTAETPLSLPNAPVQEASCSANGFSTVDTTSNCCAFQKGDTWQNDLGHVRLCRHQRWLSRSAGAAMPFFVLSSHST